MNSNRNIEEIILRYLNGEATIAEAEHLQQWIKESAANHDEFEKMSSLWNDTNTAALRAFDTEVAWQKISLRIEPQTSKVVSFFSWKKAIAVAASVIIVVTAFYFYHQSSKITWMEKMAVDSNKTLQFSDGTVIDLRKGSKVLLPDNFGKDNREIKLEGEAFFQVKHNAQNPFSIITNKSIIQDIGTSFLVQSHDTVEQVTVMEGEVSFASKKKSGKELRLQAGESAGLEKEGPERKIVEVTNLLSWKTNILVFNDTPLSQVANDLKSYYAINVHVPAELSSIQVTARFDNEPITKVVDELQLLTGLNFQLKGNELHVAK